MKLAPTDNQALDCVNEAFHGAYERARDEAVRAGPVFIVLADSLILHRDEERRELPFTPAQFHAIKSVAHGAVALYAMLERGAGEPLSDAVTHRLKALRDHVDKSLTSLAEHVAKHDEGVNEDLRAMLEELRVTISSTLDEGAIAAAALAAFAHRAGVAVRRLTHHATRVQLAAIHRCVEEALAGFTTGERAALQVVVAGDHQARARSLGMQYFKKLLREPAGADERVTYGEGVTTEQEALALVGARRLDRAIARAFFGDEKRLQRDVLGDVAAEQLAALDLASIAGA
jgi:hypothetical protein